ncbi:MAG: hypothetical protein ACI89L_000186 [Phycisphaerales bacterium]
MSGEAISPGRVAGVVVAACASARRGEPAGSDSALLAALASDRPNELLVIRSGPWADQPARLGGCRVRVIRPPVGCAWAAGPAIRRHTSGAAVPVWAEPRDLGSLRGFSRAAVSAGPTGAGIAKLAESIAASHAESNSGHASNHAGNGHLRDRVASIVVLGSHPSRLDARAVVFASSLAAVSGQPVRVVVPRGVRNVDSGRRYARRLNLKLSLELCDGPSWLQATGADVVFLDRAYESSTQFGPSLSALAQALGRPIVDLPGTLPVGRREARRYGQPLLEALGMALRESGPTLPAA